MPSSPSPAPSTGPRTDSGKARSAQNSLKHGLSGAGKFLPDQLAAEVESRKVEFTDRFHPRDSFATFLVGQLALASVRIEHCQRLELEMTNHYLQHSASDQQAAHDDQLAAYLLHARIHRDPPTIRLQLLQTPAGRDILLRKLSNLLFGLTSGQCVWTSDDVTRLLDLLGFSREERHLDQEAVALKTLADVARNPSAPLDDRKTAGTALFERLQFEITKRRQESPDRALETSKNALRADGRWFHNHDDLKRLRRYEAAANRLFFKTLALLEADSRNSHSETPPSHPPARSKPTLFPEKSLANWLSNAKPSNPPAPLTSPAASPNPTRDQKRAATLQTLTQLIPSRHPKKHFPTPPHLRLDLDAPKTSPPSLVKMK